MDSPSDFEQPGLAVIDEIPTSPGPLPSPNAPRPRWQYFLPQRLATSVEQHILLADDSPHRISLGVALGVFVAFTPTYGAQMVLVVALAWLLRANKLAGVPLVWITNPVTAVPIYYTCYLTGCYLLGHSAVNDPSWAAVAETGNLWADGLLNVAVPLTLGAIVVGLVAAVPSYWGVYLLLARRKNGFRQPA